eukprot:TRINITY_DN5145_c0_g1_i14.p1 TRINITY_DN5145_c0_g1~~TRINITY_DN5145_c0_g1_i14.p1  ORF type:complete len:296 (-),score=21.55 TRINITY_DN5145_c0_g1_i14:1187-2074(-)
MVSFLRYLCVDYLQSQQVTYDNYESNELPTEIVSPVYEEDLVLEEQFSARSTPSARRATFQSMLTDIHNSQGGKLGGWSLKKIHQYTCYLTDRLSKSKAFRGYFQIICRLVDVLKQHLYSMLQNGRQLPGNLDKEALIMTLMCVQALNKVYGRRSDVRASCHILIEKVATEFQVVAETLKDGMRAVDRSLQIRTPDFIVPKDSRLLSVALKREVKLKAGLPGDSNGAEVKEGILRILQAYKIRIRDFTQGDILWLERECIQDEDASKQNSTQQVLAWLLHIALPQIYPMPNQSKL